MEIREKQLLKNYLSNMHTEVILAGYNTVDKDWEDLDYTPDYNKFYYICDGEGWLKIGEEEYYPKPGQLFLMPQGVTQSYSTISNTPFTKYWCHFTAHIGDTNLFDVVKLPTFIEVGHHKELTELFQELITSDGSVELTSSLILKSCLLKLISFYIDHNIIEKINLANSDAILKLNLVLDYIENNYNRTITVEELSMMVHLQPNYFIRMFKKNMGSSPIHYINTRRIAEVKRLLSSTDLTLSLIGAKVGTNDIHYLSKLFKKYTSFTPTEYRKMVQQDSL